MADEIQKEIFSRNLKKLLSDRGLSQLNVANDINVSPQTFNTWIQCIALPRMGKVQLLADYFGINKSDLLEDHTDENQYYTDPETAKLAQELMDNSYTRALMDASKDAKPEDIQMATDLLLRLKGTNRDG